MNDTVEKKEVTGEKRKPYYGKKKFTNNRDKAPYNKKHDAGKPERTEKVEKTDRPHTEKSHKSERPQRTNRPERTERMEDKAPLDDQLLFGRNAVIEVLKSGRDIEKILVQIGAGEGSIKKIIGEAKSKGILVQEVEKQKLDELCQMEKHQGVVAYAAAHQYSTIDEMLNDAKSKGEDPFIIILDNIQDPHNLGAIIRSAHNAGAHGIIIPKRRAVGLTSTVAKSSAGAIEYMKVAKVSNISQTIEELKTKGIWVACADMDGEVIYNENLRGPIGIVIGSEGEGISRNVKSKCDFVVSVPMYGKVTSLNASVAASLLAYEVVRQRLF